MTTARRRPQVPLEVAVVWLLFIVIAVEVLVTYSRLPARECGRPTG